jgi:hypothetical protein
MRGKPKKILYETVPDIANAAKELTADYRAQDRLSLIVASAFGTDD